MFQIIYVSTATVPFSVPDLKNLLGRARQRNARSGLTGMMVYSRGVFLQALEGQASAVIDTFARIKNDPRHAEVITLRRGSLASGRMFGTWSMGFKDEEHSSGPEAPVKINDRINLRIFDEFSAADFLQACSRSQT